MSEMKPKFCVGQRIHHRLFQYYGVIVGVDLSFQGTEEWYRQVATSRPPKDRPWYHVQAYNDRNLRYVAERNLEEDRHTNN